MKAGKWDRKSFAGVELHGKRIGVVGFGRIGREVAARCRALGMEVVGLRPVRVAGGGGGAAACALLPLDELLQTSRLPHPAHDAHRRRRRHLIGKERARAGQAGHPHRERRARRAGRRGGAAGRARERTRGRRRRSTCTPRSRPSTGGWPQHPRVVATPHVGAQTAEAQERVGTDIAVQVRDYLKGGLIQHAVNFFSLSGDVYDQVRPAMDLAERLGRFLAQAVRRRAGAHRARPLRRASARWTRSRILAAAVRACCAAHWARGVTLVNARRAGQRAGDRRRGVDVVRPASASRT